MKHVQQVHPWQTRYVASKRLLGLLQASMPAGMVGHPQHRGWLPARPKRAKSTFYNSI